MKLCVDLCSGLGGFSQAFKEDGWEVVTIDVLRKFKPSIIADIRYLPLRNNLQPDVLLASPPCNHFSLFCISPSFPRKGIKTALEIVGACLEAVAQLKPKKWLIENPRARLRQFIGKPKQTIRYSDYDFNYPRQKPTDFWGNIPFPMAKGVRKIKRTHKLNDRERHQFNKKLYPSSAEFAKIPFCVSQAVLESVKLFEEMMKQEPKT
jgi:Site-specific DNA methylase